MAFDTPARIAILGAGPIGLEAALYGRFLGYEVDLYERGRVCENMLRWGHVRMFSPVARNRSPLAVSALAAQSPELALPDDDALLTGRELVEQYYLPLAGSDLLSDSIHEQTEVLSVGRENQLKGENVGSELRDEESFQILLRCADGTESKAVADIVIDTSGTYGNHCWLGQGGIPALFELSNQSRIDYGLPDVLHADRETYAGRHTLVVGSGYSAATNIVALAQLADEAAGTSATWITRGELSEPQPGPIALIPGDRLPERDALAKAANHLAVTDSAIKHLAGTSIASVAWDDASQTFQIDHVGQHTGQLTADAVIANVGYRPDRRIYEELQVHECYASGGPMKLAAAMQGTNSADCLDLTSCGPETLLTSEPDFYILGSKSYGRSSRFLLSTGLNQIRELFSIIGDRATLDLYQAIQLPS